MSGLAALSLRLFPIALLLLGSGVHVAALAGLKWDSEPLWTDALFLAIDLGALVGLLRRRRWGYWAAVLLFAQQLAVQGYWAVWQLARVGASFGVQQLTALLAALALVDLLLFRRIFVRPVGGVTS